MAFHNTELRDRKILTFVREHPVQPLTGCTQVILDKVRSFTAFTGKDGRSFFFVGKIPCHITDTVFIHGIYPLICLIFVNGTVSAGIADAILGDKDGKAGIRSGDHGVSQGVGVRGCIKVQSVHDIVIIRDRFSSSLIHILRPVGRTDNDDSIMIVGTDNRNDLFGIRFDIVSGRAAVGPIADLIQNIIMVSI